MDGINAVAAMKTYSSDDWAADREDIRRAINTYQNTCGLPLHVFDDNSCPTYVEYLRSFKGIFLHTHRENVGPTENSNRGMSLFKKYHEIDALMLLDDDIEFLKPGWSNIYLDSLSDEIQILSFNDASISGSTGVLDSGYLVSQCTSGVCVTLTRHCWLKAGNYGPLPEKYGWCHLEYYWRCATLGLVPMDGFYDVPEMEQYIRIASHDQRTAERDREADINSQSDQVQSSLKRYTAMKLERGKI